MTSDHRPPVMTENPLGPVYAEGLRKQAAAVDATADKLCELATAIRNRFAGWPHKADQHDIVTRIIETRQSYEKPLRDQAANLRREADRHDPEPRLIELHQLLVQVQIAHRERFGVGLMDVHEAIVRINRIVGREL